MKKRKYLNRIGLLMIAILFAFLMVACNPPTEATADKFPVEHDGEKKDELQFEEHSDARKDAVIDRATGAMDNLLLHLNSDETSDTGYYLGADVVINTFDANPEERSAFRLKLRANLYTYPYYLTDEDGNILYNEDGSPQVDEEKLAIHNNIIRYNDIIIEWYDAMNNQLMLGFYFDGIKPNSADPGNNLYLNLLGSKRIFLDFGDSVLYQQIVRLITNLNITTLLDPTSKEGSSLSQLADLMKVAVTNNYKEVINGDITSLFFYNVDLGNASMGVVTEGITKYMQDFFGPFEDKLDPLTNKYLGFKFSTLGTASITSLVTSMQFFLSQPKESFGEIMTGLVIDASGVSQVVKDNGNRTENVDFTSRMSFDYSLRISTDIVIDKSDYQVYIYGSYEYVGELFIPFLNLEMDALVRTNINENDPKKGLDNSTNKVFMQFYDKSNDDVLIGLYYTNELTYIDITNLMAYYGGIQFEDLNLPKAYKDGFNLADFMTFIFDTIDEYIVLMVTSILAPGGDSQSYDTLTEAIMANIESTMKDPNDPTSRNTIKIRIDMDLIRIIMRETSENGTEYTNKQLIDLIDEMFGIEIRSIAALMGMNVETLMESLYFEITYDVDEYSIRFDVKSREHNPEGDLLLRLDLYPQKIGEPVKISFPFFDNFKPLQRVMTYSGYMEGQIIFAQTEEVDLSKMLGAVIGELSGKNTPYILPEAANIYFTLNYDQYIRDQILANGRWTRAGRSAFNLLFYVIENNTPIEIMRLYANDVGFDTTLPVEEFGYVWVELSCIPGMPKMKIREDMFIKTMSMYMGVDVIDDEGITIGLTTILQALLEDSWVAFEPMFIRMTTSNQTFKDFFRVDELIATVAAQIGFKQRVFNIDQLESGFAMYTVGELANLSGASPYEIQLHSTIPVYFDFGDRIVVKNFFFDYDLKTIEVITGETRYYPTIDGLFMGVVRYYMVSVSGELRGRSKINELVIKHLNMEPIGDRFATTAAAYYGTSNNQQSQYPAEYFFYGYYDRSIGYYVIPNDLGYKILYDMPNETYIVDLGTNYKYDKAEEFLKNDNKRILYKTFTDINDNEYVYTISSKLYGYYVVKNERNFNLLYNIFDDYYVVSDPSKLNDARILVGYSAKIYCITGDTVNGREAVFDVKNKGYIIINDYNLKVLYDINGNYLVANDNDSILVSDIFGVSNVFIETAINFNDLDLNGLVWNAIDWTDMTYKDFVFTEVNWDNMTLEGGLFIVEVIIGRNKMATYRELITMRVYNRVIDTDKYINANVYDQETDTVSKIKAPVAASVDVDPYVYIILKSDYENNLKPAAQNQENNTLLGNFVTWYFNKYLITLVFTQIYGNSNDTQDESDNFIWNFEYADGNHVYSEQNIHNRVAENSTETTYVIMNFKGQIVALQINVLPRTILYIKFEGEKDINTYTVDALLEDTHTLPTNPTIYFKELDKNNEQYTLNFSNYRATPTTPGGIIKSTIFANSPVQVSSKDIIIADEKRPAGLNKFDSVIVWSNPVADNVQLVNLINPNTGSVKPFISSEYDYTTSFLNIKDYVDPSVTQKIYERVGDPTPDKIGKGEYSLLDEETGKYITYIDDAQGKYIVKTTQNPQNTWFSEGWYSKPIITVWVLMPDKEVDTITYNFDDGTSHTVHNATLKDGVLEGLWYADPYDSATWRLPSSITVHFNMSAPYDSKTYEVAWDLAGGAVEKIGQYYYIKNINEGNRSYFEISTKIGNDKVGYLNLKFTVIKQSGIISNIEYLDDEGRILAGSFDWEAPYPYDSSNPTDKSYIYYVDTYTRFDLPTQIRIRFNDGEIRTYKTEFGNLSPWAPGTIVNITTPLVAVNFDENGQEVLNITSSKSIVLSVFVAERSLIELQLQDKNGVPIDITAFGANAKIEINITIRTVNAGMPGYVHTPGSIIVSGIDFDMVYDKLSLNPYEFLKYITQNIYIKMGGIGEIPAIIDSSSFKNENHLTDVFDEEVALRIFDTQKVIKGGQSFTLYIGQGALADDYTIEYSGYGVDEITYGAISSISEEIVLEAYDLVNNMPNYGANGHKETYVFSDEFEVKVTYANAGEVIYNKGGIPLTYPWFIGKPAGIAEPTYTMQGVYEGRELSELTWDIIEQGGYIWITTMLPDGSRVYRKIVIALVDIGDDFSSHPEDESIFKIVNGVITIETIYNYFPLYQTLVADALPKRIVTRNIVIPIYSWTILDFNFGGLTSLTGVTYETKIELSDNVFIAEAKVGEEIIKVQLVIKPSVVASVEYVDSSDNSKDFVASKTTGSQLNFDFDAYHNGGYNGSFTLPSTLKITFQSGESILKEGMQYLRFGTNSPITYIPYNYRGHTMSSEAGTVNGSTVNIVFIMHTQEVNQQRVNLAIKFLNKEVTHVEMAGSGGSVDGEYLIDPYYDREVPLSFQVCFAEGAPLNYTISDWSKPADYEVKYNTYREILSKKGAQSDYFALSSTLSFGGMQPQTLNLKVRVFDRVMDTWALVSGMWDNLADTNDPTTYYHYADPFAGRASDLPGNVLNHTSGTYGFVNITDINIVWKDFYDSTITTDGTVVEGLDKKMGRLVTGYIGNEEYGQKVVIRVLIDKWEFYGIRQPMDDADPSLGWRIMSDDIRFLFSPLTKASAYNRYEIIMRVTSALGQQITVSNKNVVFFPEDIDPSVFAANDAYANNGIIYNPNYTIIWDSNAKTAAFTTTQATGPFYLANGNRAIKITRQSANYQYEKASINMIDFGYGAAGTNRAIYVNNLMLKLEALPTTVSVYGTLNQSFDAYLGEATINWGDINFSHNYLRGGVYVGKRITLTLTKNDYVLTQDFNIMFVFLDMSPINQLSYQSGTGFTVSNMHESEIRTLYTANTYNGEYNPYGSETYTYVMSALNEAALLLPRNGDGKAILNYTILEWDIPPTGFPPVVTQVQTYYSKKIQIDGIDYQSSIIRVDITP